MVNSVIHSNSFPDEWLKCNSLIGRNELGISIKQKTRKVSSRSKKTPIDMGGDARKLQVSTDFLRNPSEEGAACFRFSEQDSNVVSVEFTLNV